MKQVISSERQQRKALHDEKWHRETSSYVMEPGEVGGVHLASEHVKNANCN